jgi:2-oxoglutarate ferredoxin oxidoreductase subunit gamma
MEERIICAGFGGQGIMLLGKFIAFGAMNNGFNVTWMPSYGAEVRGGTAHSMVIVSDDEIASPIVSLCDTAIIMNLPSFGKFLSRVKKKGTLILNSSLINTDTPGKDITILKVPMTDIAHEIGDLRVANMVALGVYLEKKKLFSKELIIRGLEIAFPYNKKLVELNIKALEKGMSIK